jgi:hypothetical protein
MGTSLTARCLRRFVCIPGVLAGERLERLQEAWQRLQQPAWQLWEQAPLATGCGTTRFCVKPPVFFFHRWFHSLEISLTRSSQLDN